MEASILRQRKALKESIMKFVPVEDMGSRRKISRTNKAIFSERKGAVKKHNTDYMDDYSRQLGLGTNSLTEASSSIRDNFNTRLNDGCRSNVELGSSVPIIQ